MKLGRKMLVGILLLIEVALLLTVWSVHQVFLYKSLISTVSFDYVIYSDGEKVVARNGLTGLIDFSSENISDVIKFAVGRGGRSLFIKSGQYNVSSNIWLRNVNSLKIISDGAKLRFNGGSLILWGEDFEKSKNNLIEGLTLINGNIVIENSFMTSVRECIFKDSEAGIILLNSNTWTECTLIENCYFENVKRCIVFKTPIKNGTESYANTEIKRCNFKLIGEGSIAIHVENGSNFNEGLIQNVRIWLGNMHEDRQTGILLEGSMLNTVLNNVAFESFAENPSEIYGVKIGENGNPPIFGLGVVFLGNFTRKIDNPFNKWLYGVGSCFKFENINVPVGLNDNYGNTCEVTPPRYLYFSILTISLKIRVEGNFSENESVTLRLRLKSVDDSYSGELIKTFSSNSCMWLDYDDLLSIWPTVNIISSIVFDSKTNVAFSSVKIYISVYGQFN